MNSFSPSYLHKNRFGKYYFRCRIPLNIRKKYNLKKVEIRKSLNTGNRTEALRLSRIMWVEMEKSEFSQKVRDLEFDMEQQQVEDTEGRKLLKEFLVAQIKSKETGILEDEDVDTFFVDDYLTESETHIFFRKINNRQEELLKKQLDIFSELPLEKQKKILLNLKAEIEQSESVTTVEPLDQPTLTEDFADIVAKKIQQAEKKKLTVFGLQEAFETYLPLESQARDWSDEGYVRKVKSDIQLFIDLVEVINCSDLSDENIVYYSDMVRKLPKKYDSNPRCKGLSYEEMVRLPNEKKIAPKTIKNKVNNVIAFLEWCDSRNYIDVEYEKPFKKIRKVRGGSKKGGKNKRVAYSPDELKKLFNSKEYQMGTHKTANHHWVPLIGLFTGARLGEICQLRKEHVVKDSLSDIWYFDFNDYSEGDSIKTDAGLRFVPIHPQLRKLGFFRYLKMVEEGSQLFPKWRKSHAICKNQMRWFSRTYRENCGVEKPEGIMKDFHSLRNTIINAMKQAGVPVASAREIVGHEDEDMSYGGYADPLDLPSRKKVINKIKYPLIDWNLMKEREWRQPPAPK